MDNEPAIHAGSMLSVSTSTQERGFALNEDGELKDVSEIEWFNDPDDEVPISLPSVEIIPPPRPADLVPSHTLAKRKRDATSSPQNAKKVKLASSWLDLEAQEDGGESDDDNEEEEDNGFLNDGPVDEESARTRGMQRLEENEQDGFLDHLAEKYMRPLANPGASAAELRLEKDAVEDDGSRLPREEDCPIWEVRVRVEHEPTLVLKLFERSMQGLHLPGEQPRSIFANKRFPGCVFVEAPSKATVVKLCQGLNNVQARKVTFMDHLDALRCLTPSRASYQPQANTWVRMQKQGYRGDLAYILRVDDATGKIDIVLLPRIQYKGHVNDEGGPGKPGKPPAAPLDHKKVKSGKETITMMSGGAGALKGYRFRKQRYDVSGFWLLRGVEARDYLRAKALPTLDELITFCKCVSVPRESLNKQFRFHELRALRPGSQVKVTVSPGDARIGTIEHVDLDIAYVRFRFCAGEPTPVPLQYVRRHFNVGDRVRVLAGDRKNLVAWVVGVDETTYLATLHSHEGNIQVTVSVHCIEMAEDDRTFVRQSPPRPTNAKQDMKDHVFERLVGMEVHAIKAPYKGQRGWVRAINLQGQALVSFDGRHVHSGQLIELPATHMLYRSKHGDNWYRLDSNHNLKIPEDAQHLVASSLVLTPDTSRVEGEKWTSPLMSTKYGEVLERLNERNRPQSSPGSVDQQGIQDCRTALLNPEMPPGHWLRRLSGIIQPDERVFLRVTERAKDWGGGAWVGRHGYFSGIERDNVKLTTKSLDSSDYVLQLPYYMVEPRYPARLGTAVMMLEDSELFGRVMMVKNYGVEVCKVEPIKPGPKKSAPVATKYLATFARVPSSRR